MQSTVIVSSGVPTSCWKGLVPLTHEATVPYLIAVSLPARMCNTVIFYIPATFHIEALRFYFTLYFLWESEPVC